MATASEPGRRSVDPDDAFSVTADFEPPRMTLALSGELDLAGTPPLERAIKSVPWSYLKELVVDLAQVTFIDSTGLSVLIRASQLAATAGVGFSVVRVPEQPRQLFALTGVADSLNARL